MIWLAPRPTGSYLERRSPRRSEDSNGHPVYVGSRVRVLKISTSLEHLIPADEFARLRPLVGQVLPISEID